MFTLYSKTKKTTNMPTKYVDKMHKSIDDGTLYFFFLLSEPVKS